MPNNIVFEVVIATKDRHEDLILCLQSLSKQLLPPCRIIIIDASSPGRDPEQYQTAAGILPVLYERAKHSGLPSQRNYGLSLLHQDTKYVIFVDDDVIVAPDYCQVLIEKLETDRELAGIGGWITNPLEAPSEKWFRWFLRLFLIYGRVPGKLLSSGFNTPMFIRMFPNLREFASECLEGCNMCYRMSSIKGLQFDTAFERFAGYAYAEDIDFSYRISKYGRLVVTPKTTMIHQVSPAGRLRDFRFGISQVTNRALLVYKHMNTPFNWACYFWSMLGIMLLNAAMITRGRSPRRLIGNIVGLVLILSGELRRIYGLAEQ